MSYKGRVPEQAKLFPRCKPQDHQMPGPIQSVLVCGYGTMGRGIVNLFARGEGFRVTVLTRDPSRLADLPAGVKTLLEHLGIGKAQLRLPLLPASAGLKTRIIEEFEAIQGLV